jgi:hypothetical protein
MGAADFAQRCSDAAGRDIAGRDIAPCQRAFALRWLTPLLTCVALGPASSRGAQPAVANPAVRIVEVLDDAVAALDRPGADVRRVLTVALRALPKDAPPAIGEEIEHFLGRLPVPGVDFRCAPDFLRGRAMAEVFRLIDATHGEAVQPIGPRVCYAVPYAVDASRPPGRVEIYGFDLDMVETEMVLVANGSYRDISAALVRHSPTYLTLDLNHSVAALKADDDLLGFAWGNVIHYRIPVVQPATPLCHSWIQRIEQTQLPLSPPLVDARPPARLSGRVRAFVVLDHVMNQVEANVCASLTGARAYAGCALQFVQTVDADRIIEGIVGATASRLDTRAAPGVRSSAIGASAGPVRQWSWQGLGGEDAPQLTANLGAITVISSDKERCISAVDFLEARRAGGLAATTVQRLGPQVKRMPPVIRSMRPRFAPADLR